MLYDFSSAQVLQRWTASWLVDEASRLYSHPPYLALVQDYAQNGLVLRADEPTYRLALQRGAYQVEHCAFPLAFVQQGARLCLLKGSDWNRLDLLALPQGKNLTAREISYEKQLNYFDYFHGQLLASPSGRGFCSMGFHWGPADIPYYFELETFGRVYENQRLSAKLDQTSGYHWERPACWLDGRHFALAYHPNEDEDLAEETHAPLLVVVDFEAGGEIVERLPCPAFLDEDNYHELKGFVYFEPDNQLFLAGHAQTGLYLLNREAQVLRHLPQAGTWSYQPAWRQFYEWGKAGWQAHLLAELLMLP